MIEVSMLFVALLVGGLALLMWAAVGPLAFWVTAGLGALGEGVLWTRRYRPPENHLAAVYRRGYFQRWVKPGKWTLLAPRFERVEAEFDLGGRAVRRRCANVLTRDQVPLDIELKASFSLDPLRFPLSFRPRAVKLPAEAWQNLVADRLEDILRNEVAPRFSGERLLSLSGRAEARRMLSDRLFFRLERLGIFVNPADGVTLGNLLPNPVYLKALQEVSAAAAFGEAARERVLPTLDAAALGNGLPTAWDTFVLGAAAAVNREARLGELSINPGSGAVRTPRRPPRRRSRPRPAGQPLMQ